MKLIALEHWWMKWWWANAHRPCCYKKYFSQAKFRYSFQKLFHQIMELSTKWSNKIHLQPDKCTLSSSWKKLKTMFFLNLDFQILIISMSYGLLPSRTSGSNLLLVSLHNPIITKTMVVVAKGYPPHVMGKAMNDVFWPKMQLHKRIKC